MMTKKQGPPELALHCDEYELTMAQSFLAHGQADDVVTFELAVRTLPNNRGCLVVAGLEQAVEYLRSLRFTHDQLDYLRGQKLLDGRTLEALASTRFSGDLDAIPEGTCVGAGVPLLQVTARRFEATLIESALLAIVNHQTLVASKAARIVAAADGRPVYDFSLRRLHGPQAGPAVARAAWIAGCAGSATVEAGRRFGIPTVGTMAHHYVLAFGPDREQDAFEQFLRDFPGRATLLVDTYDTVRGVRRAIAASRATGIALQGIRLDSGDLRQLSLAARRELDEAGSSATRILASNDLDEWTIADLVASGAPIDAFGVGTMLGTSADAPALGGVYKLTEQTTGEGRRAVMKAAAGKVTDPGRHTVVRSHGDVVVGLATEALRGESLLQAVMRGGRLTAALPSLEAVRAHCAAELANLPPGVLRPSEPRVLGTQRSPGLLALTDTLTTQRGSLDVVKIGGHAMSTGSVRALIAVDCQGSFLPGGELAVSDGAAVVAPLVAVIDAGAVDLVIASVDFHPANHCSFAAQGGPWPPHGVAGTAGARVHEEIARRAALTVAKGTRPDADAYSAFDRTGLADILRAASVTDVYVGGLATDYCVRATALDAVRAGFHTHLLVDAVRAVDVTQGDGDRAIAEMVDAGVQTATTLTVVEQVHAGGHAAA